MPPPLTLSTGELRRRAEDQLNAGASGESALAGDDTQKLVHELQVHQLELEMQNQALREARTQISRNLDQLTDLYDLAPVAYLNVPPN